MKSLVIAILLIATASRNETWASEVSLQENITQGSADKPRVHLNLGAMYQREGRFDDALNQYALTVKLVQERPWDSLSQRWNLGAVATTNAAAVYADHERLDEAQRILLAMPFPKPLEWYNQAAVVELRRDEPIEAMRILDAGIARFPDSAILLYNLAETFRVMGKCPEAIAGYARAESADRTLGIIPKTCEGKS